MTEITRENVYQKVADYLLNMESPSAELDACLYRSPDGNKCPIGWLIKDEYYNSDMDGMTVTSHEGTHLREALVESLGFVPDFYRLRKIQLVHDNWAEFPRCTEYRRKQLQSLGYSVSGADMVER